MVTATDAVAQGMADRVDTFDNTLARMMSGVSTVVPAKNGSLAFGFEAFEEEASLREALERAAAEEFGNVYAGDFGQARTAGPIPYRKTDTVDVPWDGPGEEAKLTGGSEANLRPMYAWVDSDEDPKLKGSYKFPHHQVDNGDPGPANVNGCEAVKSRLTQADIPESDRAAVEAHVQHHIDDHKSSGAVASGEETLVGTSPQDRLAGLRQRSRAAATSERQTYLSLLRRMIS